MNKKKIISITGGIATGKTEVAKIISQKLNMQSYSGSEGFRKLAEENGMNLLTFNEYIKDKPYIDKEIDASISEYMRGKDNIVIDARLAWYFEKNSFKVYVKSSIEVAAKRLLEDNKKRVAEKRYTCLEEAKEAILYRQKHEVERYIKEYGVNLLESSNYDLVVDSSDMPIDEVADKVISKYLKWISENN